MKQTKPNSEGIRDSPAFCGVLLFLSDSSHSAKCHSDPKMGKVVQTGEKKVWKLYGIPTD